MLPVSKYANLHIVLYYCSWPNPFWQRVMLRLSVVNIYSYKKYKIYLLLTIWSLDGANTRNEVLNIYKTDH